MMYAVDLSPDGVFHSITGVPLFIATFDCLAAEIARDLMNDLENSPLRRPGVVGDSCKVDDEVKRSQDVCCDVAEATGAHAALLAQLQVCVNAYVDRFPAAGNVQPFGVSRFYNVQRYLPGDGYYQLHCERASRQSAHRHLAWMAYLNSVDNAGTEFPMQQLTLEAVQGRLVIWPSDWTHVHRGIISNTQTKYIATGWLSYVD